MKLKLTILSLSILMVLLGTTLIMQNNITEQNENEIEPATMRFVISSWSYPDAYDQGIEAIEVFENSTGSWVQEALIHFDDPAADQTLEWDVGVGIRIDIWTRLNSSLVGCSSRPEGKLFHRHYLIVKDSSDATIFSQQNFTYQYSDEDEWPLYFYGYRVEPDFLPVIGEIYSFEFMYEIYY